MHTGRRLRNLVEEYQTHRNGNYIMEVNGDNLQLKNSQNWFQIYASMEQGGLFSQIIRRKSGLSVHKEDTN